MLTETKTVSTKLKKLNKKEHPARCPCCNYVPVPVHETSQECINEGTQICGLMIPDGA